MTTIPETETEVSLGVRLISVLLTPKHHMDTKILTHPTSCLSAKFNFSMKIDKLLSCFSVCSLKVFQLQCTRAFEKCARSIRIHQRGKCVNYRFSCRAPSQSFGWALNTRLVLVIFLAFLYKKNQLVCSLLLLITYIVFDDPTIQQRSYNAKCGKSRYMTDSLTLIQIQSIYLAQIKQPAKIKRMLLH